MENSSVSNNLTELANVLNYWFPNPLSMMDKAVESQRAHLPDFVDFDKTRVVPL